MKTIDIVDFEKLVEFLSTKADSFSFTADYKKRLTEKDCTEYIAADKQRRYNEVRRLWDEVVPKEEKKYLPAFEDICSENEKRVELYYKIKKRTEIALCAMSKTQCLAFSHSKGEERLLKFNADEALFGSKFKDIRGIDQIYNAYDSHADSKIYAELLLNKQDEYSENYGLAELDLPHNHLIREELTNCWPSTSTTALHRVFYFSMNDESKQWLLSYKLLSKLPLEDIAFYKNGKVVFSVCTHENFYSASEFKNEIAEFEISERITSVINEENMLWEKRENRHPEKVWNTENIIKAAENGDPEAQFELGYFYWGKDSSLLKKWLGKASAQGNGKATCFLGHYYINKNGSENADKAAQLYALAATQGYADAIFILAQGYDDGTTLSGIKHNDKKAAELYIKAAMHGNKIAHYYAGCCYYNGKGVGRDYRQAEMFLSKFLEGLKSGTRYHNAKYMLAMQYIEGLGIPRDYKKGVAALQPLADVSSDAMIALARCYENGLGTKKDIEKAFKLYEQAYIFGSTEAAQHLSYCYRNGININKNPIKAAEWSELVDLDVINLEAFLNNKN